MQQSGSKPLVGIVCAIACALLVVGMLTFAGPCVHEDGSVGTCVWAHRSTLGAAVVCLVLSLVRVFERSEGERRGLDVGMALTATLVAITPDIVVGLCPDLAMQCHQVMAPFVRACGVLVALIAAADLVIRLNNIVRNR